MADEETDEQSEELPAARGGGNKIMIMMALLNLVAVGGIGAFLVINQNNQANAAQHAAPIRVPTGAVRGPLVPLEPLVVNLNVAGATRYLKVTAQVELPEGTSPEEFSPNLVPIRHRLLIELSALTIEDTQGADKKLKLQEDLRDKINEMLGAGTITRILFTEFVVQ